MEVIDSHAERLRHFSVFVQDQSPRACIRNLHTFDPGKASPCFFPDTATPSPLVVMLQRLKRFRRRMVRRARRSEVLAGLMVFTGLVVLMISLPVTLPLVAVLHAREMRRRRLAVENFACAVCGNVLGEPALARADTVWAGYIERLCREKPGYRFRLVRRVHAVCTRCGAGYEYDDSQRVFRPLPADAF